MLIESHFSFDFISFVRLRLRLLATANMKARSHARTVHTNTYHPIQKLRHSSHDAQRHHQRAYTINKAFSASSVVCQPHLVRALTLIATVKTK